MKRFLFQTLIALGLIGAMLPSVQAQGYPNKPIRLIVPVPPGGGNDVIGRLIAQKLTE
jgi:tripartite-type tricarboxylate transporter receptor subunit TctC